MRYCLFSNTKRTARKRHTCIWCGQNIDIGATYQDERSVYDGTIHRHRWHHECVAASQKHFTESGEEEFDAYDNERPSAEAARE